MKNRVFIFLLASSGLLASCNFLEVDKYFDEQLTLEKVFSSKTYTEQWLRNTYSYMNYVVDVSSREGTIENFADDLCFNDFGETSILGDAEEYGTFLTVAYDESYRQTTWTYCWQGINKACTFLQHIDSNGAYSDADRADLKAQARFVRAYYYWALLKKYGPIPLLPEEGPDYGLSYDELSIPRRPYWECADYIADEFAKAAVDLPLKRDGTNIARPTRGAALGYRAKVLLYAASPLMNGNNDSYAARLVDDQGNRLISAEYDERRWALAAAAALDVMDLNVYELVHSPVRTVSMGRKYPKTVKPFADGEFSTMNWPDGYADIDPFESYRSVFNGSESASTNSELLFTRGKNGNNGWDASEQYDKNFSIEKMVADLLPKSAQGRNRISMTQKQCDAYYMYDGKDVPGKDSESGGGDGSVRPGIISDSEASDLSFAPALGEDASVRKGISKQYANREPRFYASVAYNGRVWGRGSEVYTESKPITYYQSWYYRNSDNGKKNGYEFPLTGIGFMKYVHPDDSQQGDASAIVAKVEPALRYADILLCYAEALNELQTSYTVPSYDGRKMHQLSRSQDELERGVHPVRIRAGLPDWPDAAYENRDLFREKLKRERQIEFVGECQRYYDLRRWKDAEKEYTKPIYGCNMNIPLSGSSETEKEKYRILFHTPVEVPNVPAVFVDKSYFWPFSKTELKRNKRLTQNPGWNIYD